MLYAFDPEGDGVFTPFGIVSAAGANVTLPGPFVPAVKVQDPVGLTATEYFPMDARQFSHSVIAYEVSGLSDPSLAVVAGRPAIAFAGEYSGVYFAINSQADGDGSWTISQAKITYSAGVKKMLSGAERVLCPCPLAVSRGVPHLLYTISTESGSLLMHASNTRADGSGEWIAGQVGVFRDATSPVLGFVGGRTAVLYVRENTLQLRVYALVSATEWDLLWSADVGSGDLRGRSDLGLVGDPPVLPAFVYYDANKAGLFYVVNTRADGGGEWLTSLVDQKSAFVWAPSLAMVGGRPAVAYRDDRTGELIVSTNAAADGQGAWTRTVIEGPVRDVTDVARRYEQSLAMVDGLPAVAYFHPTQGLMYAYHSRGDLPGYWPTALVDRLAPGQQAAPGRALTGAPSLAWVAERPAIAYTSGPGGGELHFARAR